MCRVFSMAAFVIAVVVSAPPAEASGPMRSSTLGATNVSNRSTHRPTRAPRSSRSLCNCGAAQQWMEISVGSNIFHYKNVLGGLCLDARGRAKNGTPVQQWTCNRIGNESWQPGEYMPDYI